MTKAYFKDGNNEHAVKYFQDQMIKQIDVNDRRREFYITLYDKLFTSDEAKLSKEEFKERYLNIHNVISNFQAQAGVFHLLKDAVKEGDYAKIESIYGLSTLRQEEHSLLISSFSGKIDFNKYENESNYRQKVLEKLNN
jgi:hypothetical protein